MNLGTTLLAKILSEYDSGESLEVWGKIKLKYLPESTHLIYNQIVSYNEEYGSLPSFEALKLNKNEKLVTQVAALEKIKIPSVEAYVILDALIDEYAQQEALEHLDSFLNDVPKLDAGEIKHRLNDIVLDLEDKIQDNERIFTMADFTIIAPEEQAKRISLGLNTRFDINTGGVFTSDLILVGGARGSGKSVICTNLVCNQFDIGNASIYFSIEMRAREVFQRIMSVLADVKHSNIRKNSLETDDLLKLAKARASMFIDGEECYSKYLQHFDFQKFEAELVSKPLLRDKQLIIVDNQQLTLSDIDIEIHKAKLKFGDRFKVAVVDYVNQIVPTGADSIYDWKVQVELSKGLKNLARKHEVCIVAPYQVDSSGEARFAKGLLDAPDLALVMSKKDDHLAFKTTKSRSSSGGEFFAGINWETLKISKEDYTPKEFEGGEDIDRVEEAPPW